MNAKSFHPAMISRLTPSRQVFVVTALAVLWFMCASGIVKSDTVNPPRALWLELRAGLIGPKSETNWKSMKDTLVPGEFQGIRKFEAVVLASSTNTIVLAIRDPRIPEITLRLEEPLRSPVPIGSYVEFDGYPRQFTAEPFMVVLDVPANHIVVVESRRR